MILKAKFIGKEDSVGFIYGKVYSLLLGHELGERIKIRLVQKDGKLAPVKTIIPYNTIIGFLRNWEIQNVIQVPNK